MFGHIQCSAHACIGLLVCHLESWKNHSQEACTADHRLRDYGRTSGYPAQGVRGGREDLCLKVDEGIGGSPAERVRADGPIAISESTGGTPAQSKRVDRWIAISESMDSRANRRL